MKDDDLGRCPGPVLCEVLGRMSQAGTATSPVPVACEEEAPNYIEGPVEFFDAHPHYSCQCCGG